MSSRSFSACRPSLLAAALLAGLASQAGAQVTTVNTHRANPTGVQFGFWENQTYQDATMGRYGRRPSARVGIDGWASIENTQLGANGQLPDPSYNWTQFDKTTLASLKSTHQHGESALVAVNVSFTPLVSNKNTIPAVYNPDITDPVTRARALAFVQAYVKHLAGAIGSFTLTIDYEINDNYRLVSRAGDPKTCPGAHWYDCRDQRAQTWAAWYADAAQAARDAIADYNSHLPAGVAPATLTLQPIMNGDVSDPLNAMNSGDNSWYGKVVAGSDQIAFDTYHCSANTAVTDATHTLANMMAWAQLTWGFDKSKHLVVTENGFSSGLTPYVSPAPPPPSSPTVCASNNGKYVGTDTEQAAYFTDLFKRLHDAMSGSGPYGALRGRVDAFHVWSIVDNPLVANSDTDHYFGMVMAPSDPSPGTDKPAAPAVYDGIVNQFEGNADLAPMTTSGGSTLGNSAPLNFSSGVEHDFLAYSGSAIKQACTVSLTVANAQPGDTVLVRVSNSTQWSSKPAVAGAPTTIDLKQAQCNPGSQQNLQLEVYVTGPYWPMTRTVKNLHVDPKT